MFADWFCMPQRRTVLAAIGLKTTFSMPAD
jgi:hypothetical protein